MGFEPWAHPSENDSVNKFVNQMRRAQKEAKAALVKAKEDMACCVVELQPPEVALTATRTFDPGCLDNLSLNNQKLTLSPGFVSTISAVPFVDSEVWPSGPTPVLLSTSRKPRNRCLEMMIYFSLSAKHALNISNGLKPRVNPLSSPAEDLHYDIDRLQFIY
ncbi:hypothetical protein E4T56_gene6665 [Termitomyces sp. T112]|nr:hypothetical protein E4T56_gene6665 [Termitomyces sp. T112]